MARGVEQTRALPKEVPPVGSKINWWGFLGLLCMVSSAFLSVGILYEILDFLKAAGMLRSLAGIG